MEEEKYEYGFNWARAVLVSVFILLLTLCLILLIVARENGEKSGDNACKSIGYSKLTGNSIGGYYCASDNGEAVKVTLECGLSFSSHNCKVYKITGG